MSSFKCKSCSEIHEGPPLSYGAEAPSTYYNIPDDERDKRCLLSSEQCIIDDELYFIVGNIYIPIINKKEMFNWSVWVSLSEESYNRTSDLWETNGRENETSYFGWLSTELPNSCYPNTINLKTNIQTQKVGERPIIELQDLNHPLGVEQKNGISWERVEEIATLILHNKNS